MLSYKEAAGRAHRVRFDIVSEDYDDVFNMNAVVEDIPISLFMEKIWRVDEDWFKSAILRDAGNG